MVKLCKSGDKRRPPRPKSRWLLYEQLEQRQLLSINNRGITGAVFIDVESNGFYDEADTPLANQLVYVDQNRNGVMDRHRFRASRLELEPISTNAHTRFAMSLPESDAIADIDLVADIDHARLSDLAMALISPSGTRVELFAPRDLSVSDLDVIRFDDHADQAIQTVTDPHPENVRPASSARLSDFHGEDPGGWWILEFQDIGKGSLGLLNSWHLEFTIGDYVTQTNDRGEYAFDHLPVDPGEVHVQSLHSWSRVIVAELQDEFDFGVVQDGRLGGTVFHDSNVDGVRGRSESGLSSRTVFLDRNGNGRRDIQKITMSSSDSKSITDFHTATSEIQSTGLEGTVIDINVQLYIRHSWNDDLDVFLMSPAGTRVELMTDIGESRDDFWGTIFDDEAEEYITDNFLSYGLTFQPEGTLADFDGEDPNGTWSLVIKDDERWDTGTLEAWSVEITYGEPSAVTNEEGGYVFNNLLAGLNYWVGLTGEPGWSPTIPSHISSISLGNGQAVSNHDIGTAQSYEIGDFDQDSNLSCGDVDLLFDELAVAGQDPWFDLTLDGRVDEHDLDAWLVRSGHLSLGQGAVFRRGDANLDGVVNAIDLNAIGTNWLRHDAGWCGGDFTADGVVDARDLNHVAANWRQPVANPANQSVVRNLPRIPLVSSIAVIRQTTLDLDGGVFEIPFNGPRGRGSALPTKCEEVWAVFFGSCKVCQG